MPRMREPFTGGVFDVPASKGRKVPRARVRAPRRGAGARDRGRGFESDHEQEPAETPAADADAPKPTAESTIAEIRAWAKANGVALPKRGNKAQLLAAIG